MPDMEKDRPRTGPRPAGGPGSRDTDTLEHDDTERREIDDEIGDRPSRPRPGPDGDEGSAGDPDGRRD